MFIFLNFNIFLACGQNMSIPVPLPLFGLCNNLRRFFFGLERLYQAFNQGPERAAAPPASLLLCIAKSICRLQRSPSSQKFLAL